MPCWQVYYCRYIWDHVISKVVMLGFIQSVPTMIMHCPNNIYGVCFMKDW